MTSIDDYRAHALFLENYRKSAGRLRPRIEAIMSGQIPLTGGRADDVAWVGYGLLFSGGPVGFANLLHSMDYIGRAIPTSEEVANGLLGLRRQGWLLEINGLFGLTPKGNGVLRRAFEEQGSVYDAMRAVAELVSSDS